jgi:hypothetical protein
MTKTIISAVMLLVGVSAFGQAAYYFNIDTLKMEYKDVRSRYYGNDNKGAVKDTLRMIEARILEVEQTIEANAKAKAEVIVYKLTDKYAYEQKIGKHFNEFATALGSPTSSVPGFNGQVLYRWVLGSKSNGIGIHWGWGIATGHKKTVEASISATFDANGNCVEFSTNNIRAGLKYDSEAYHRKVFTKTRDTLFDWKSEYQRIKFGWEPGTYPHN